jgi:hypothetical protein
LNKRADTAVDATVAARPPPDKGETIIQPVLKSTGV